MDSYLPIVNILIAVGVILAQAFVALIFILIISRKSAGILRWMADYGRELALIIAGAGMIISLFYSDVVGYAPCILCWYQRIFMYPIVILAGLSIIKKDRNIVDYILALSIFGFLISLYHNVIYYFNFSAAPCAATGISCIQRFVSEISGYVSIPMMAMTGFLLIIAIMTAAKISR